MMWRDRGGSACRLQLAPVHSEWANWFLYGGRYVEAYQARQEAMRVHTTPTIAMKNALVRCAPGVAAKVARARANGHVAEPCDGDGSC